MQSVYIEGQPYSDSAVQVPLPSSAILFILRYCQTDLFHISFVKPAPEASARDSDRLGPVGVKRDSPDKFVLVPSCSVSGLNHSFISSDDVPTDVKNCALPVIQVTLLFLFLQDCLPLKSQANLQ